MAGSCCATFCKIILIFVNVIVAILALFFLVLGIMLTMAGNLMKDLIWPQLKVLLTSDNFKDANIDLTALFDPQLDLFGKLKILSIPMLVVSLVILIITFFGCYGACCKNKFMLGIYSFVMTLICLGVLAGCVVLYLKFDDAMPALESRMGILVKENYVSEENPDIISMIFTVAQAQKPPGGCCGAGSGADYEGSTVLLRRFPNQAVPVSCCVDFVNASNNTLEECTVNDKTNEAISNYNFGCFKAMQRDIKQYFVYFVAMVAGTMAFIAILAIAGWCLFAHILRQGKQLKEPHGYD